MVRVKNVGLTKWSGHDGGKMVGMAPGETCELSPARAAALLLDFPGRFAAELEPEASAASTPAPEAGQASEVEASAGSAAPSTDGQENGAAPAPKGRGPKK